MEKKSVFFFKNKDISTVSDPKLLYNSVYDM